MMKLRSGISLLLCLLLVSLFPQLPRTDAAGIGDRPNETRLTQIVVSTLPDKLTYLQNEETLDVTGGVLALYGVEVADDTDEDLQPRPAAGVQSSVILVGYRDLQPEWVSGFDNTVPGTQTLTVQYEGLTATFDVTIVPADAGHALIGIRISRLPDRLVYDLGDSEPDVTGGELTLLYADETEETVPMTADMIDRNSFRTDETGEVELRVRYDGFAAYYTIRVIEIGKIESVELIRLPDRLTYLEGGPDLDPAGGLLRATIYGEDTPEDLDLERSWVYGFDNSLVGEQILQVLLGGAETSFSVTVAHDYAEEIVAPTCTEAGRTRLICRACGDEVDQGETAPLGHAWGEPTYTWSEDLSRVTAAAVCTRDGSHVLEETADAVFTVTKEPTYTEPGTGLRTAVFTRAEFAAQQIEVALEPLELPCDGSELCPGAVFTDMPARGNWAHDAIDWAVVNHITSGSTPTTFRPKGDCTRAQVVTFLWRAAGSPEPAGSANPFTDVKTNAYYYKAVLWAVEHEITSGTSATAFSPNRTCTRGQFVTFLWRYEGKPAPTRADNPFTDVKAGAFYYDAVLWAAENGVTTGITPTTFCPANTCTRAHVVTFLYRALA